MRVKPDGFRACHVLYLAGLDEKRVRQIIDELKNAPVLTVSDGEAFARNGGIAGLFVEQGRVRFAINVEAAQHGACDQLAPAQPRQDCQGRTWSPITTVAAGACDQPSRCC